MQAPLVMQVDQHHRLLRFSCSWENSSQIVEESGGKDNCQECQGKSRWVAGAEVGRLKVAKDINGVFFLMCMHKQYVYGIPILQGEDRLTAMLSILFVASNLAASVGGSARAQRHDL